MRIFLLALWLLTGCAAQSPILPPDPIAPPAAENHFINIHVGPTPIVSKVPVTMTIELDAGQTELSLLRLSIAYPSGHSQTVVESIYGSEAALSWTVPEESGSGTATYRLSSEGCGCGPDDKGVAAAEQNSVIRGEFFIELR